MRFTKTFLSGVAALALLAGPALAQPQGPGGQPHNDYHGQPQHNDYHGQPSHNDYHGQPPNNDHHGPGNISHEDYHGGYHNGPSGPHGHWQRGDHYNGPRHVVAHGDWGRYHLHPPPSGYEWVNYNGQFMLIAITSGIIASIIAGSAYGY